MICGVFKEAYNDMWLGCQAPRDNNFVHFLLTLTFVYESKSKKKDHQAEVEKGKKKKNCLNLSWKIPRCFPLESQQVSDFLESTIKRTPFSQVYTVK